MRPDDIAPVIGIADALREAPHWPPEIYARALNPGAFPARIALVAESPGTTIVGFSVTVLIPPQAELETIAVAQEARRQGIATGLFVELLAILKQREITEVMLEVRESNHAARSLYPSLGFVETGRRGAYYSDPKEDAILFARPVGLSGADARGGQPKNESE